MFSVQRQIVCHYKLVALCRVRSQCKETDRFVQCNVLICPLAAMIELMVHSSNILLGSRAKTEKNIPRITHDAEELT